MGLNNVGGVRDCSEPQSFVLILKPRLHDATGCQTGCATGLTTGCLHDTAVLSNRLSNPFDNR